MKAVFNGSNLELQGVNATSFGAESVSNAQATKTQLQASINSLQSQLNALQNQLNSLDSTDVGLSNVQQDVDGNVGIKTSEMQADLHIEGSTYIHGDWLYLHFTEFHQSLGSNAQFIQTEESDDATNIYRTTFDVNHNQNNNFNYSLQLFRNTATSTNASFSICKPDGTATINHLFGGNSNSYVCSNNGNFGVGIASPTQKLHVNGAARITNLLLSSSQIYIGYGTAAPTTGTYVRGSMVFNSNASASTTMGWMCTAGGTPGTWKTMPSLGA